MGCKPVKSIVYVASNFPQIWPETAAHSSAFGASAPSALWQLVTNWYCSSCCPWESQLSFWARKDSLLSTFWSFDEYCWWRRLGFLHRRPHRFVSWYRKDGAPWVQLNTDRKQMVCSRRRHRPIHYCEVPSDEPCHSLPSPMPFMPWWSCLNPSLSSPDVRCRTGSNGAGLTPKVLKSNPIYEPSAPSNPELSA